MRCNRFPNRKRGESASEPAERQAECLAGSIILVGNDFFCDCLVETTREACVMVRIVLRWIDSPWAFELLPGLNKLGRNPTNDFRVSDPSVSSFHVELLVNDQEVRVRDLGSTNGTFIDEQRVDDAVLKPESTLRLGNVRFRLEEVAVTPVAQPQSSPVEAGPPAAVDLAPSCLYHPAIRAHFKCENCGAALCDTCVTVVGQGKFEATTICPVCKGQCYLLPHHDESTRGRSLLHRLTQTLRIPFTR